MFFSHQTKAKRFLVRQLLNAITIAVEIVLHKMRQTSFYADSVTEIVKEFYFMKELSLSEKILIAVAAVILVVCIMVSFATA